MCTGGFSQEPKALVDSVIHLSEEWCSSNKKVIVPKLRRSIIWRPPIAGTFKVNFDGAFSNSFSLAGVGIIVRNEEGSVMAALSYRDQCVTEPIHIEALAALRAVIFATDMGFRDICLEGDSQDIIKAINSNSIDFSPVGHLIEETKALLNSVLVESFPCL